MNTDLIRKLADALSDRINAAHYLRPERYDDPEHEQSFQKADAESRAILAKAREFLAPPDPEAEARRTAILELAREQCGDAEIDEDSILSEGDDNGCYVQAWVWCGFEGTPFDKDTPDEEDDQEPDNPRLTTTEYTDSGID